MAHAWATVGDLAAAPRRTAGFYLRTLTAWARPGRTPADTDDLPAARPGLVTALEAAGDDWLLAMFQAGRRPRPPEDIRRIRAEAEEALALYRRRGWYANPRSYFADPPPPEHTHITPARTGLDGAGGHERLTFPSAYAPDEAEPGAARWAAHQPNQTAHAWLLRHRDPRPWLICIHGAATGRPTLDSLAFRATRLHRESGLNVAIPVMPLHGARRDGIPIGIGFPDEELVDTVHAVAQAVWDIRRLIRFLAPLGTGQVGLYGVSLGAYVAALVGSIEADLACVIAGVPIVDFADLFARHSPARFSAREDYRELPSLARELHRVISPLALTPRVPRQRRFIYAGRADRLSDPRSQALALWRHWERPRTLWYPGGHIGFRQSPAVQEFVRDALQQSGITTAGSRAVG